MIRFPARCATRNPTSRRPVAPITTLVPTDEARGCLGVLIAAFAPAPWRVSGEACRQGRLGLFSAAVSVALRALPSGSRGRPGATWQVDEPILLLRDRGAQGWAR